MRREQRITKGWHYQEVYSKGGSWANRLLVLRAVPNGLDFSRFGFVASKRVGKAVVRNRVKRLLRECARLAAVEPDADIVLIARKPAADASYHDLNRAMQQLLVRAHLLVSEQTQSE